MRVLTRRSAISYDADDRLAEGGRCAENTVLVLKRLAYRCGLLITQPTLETLINGYTGMPLIANGHSCTVRLQEVPHFVQAAAR
jgi:hypothetical protein